MAVRVDTDKRLKTVTKGAGLVFIGMVISKILTYFYRLVVAKYYGPDYYGLISIGMSTIVLLTAVILLGFDSGIIRFVAFYSAKNDKGRVKGAIITPFRICMPFAIAVSLALWAFAPSFAGLFSVSPEQAVYLASIFRLLSFSIPFFVAYSLIVSVNKGLQKIKYNIYADYIFSSSVQLILVILFYSMGFDITWVAIAYSLSMAFSFFFILYFSRRNLLSVSGTKTVSYTREMFAYSLPLAVGSFASIAIISIDTIFLGIFRTATETGIYNAAMPTASIIYVFASAFGILFFPILTELYSKMLMPELKTFYLTITRWIFIVTFPFLLTFMIFPDNILGILFGPEYVYGVTALSILSLMYFINSIFSTSTFVLLVMKKTRYVMINVVAATLIICIGNVILTPIYGIYGAAITSLISSVFANALLFIEVMYFAKLSPFCVKTMAKSVLAGVASVASIFLLYKSLHLQSSFLLMTLLFVLFILLYFFLLLVLRCFSRNDIMMLSAIEKKSGIRIGFIRRIFKSLVK